MKKIFMMLLVAIIVMPVFADEKLRIAVFDPTSSGTAIDEGTKVAIREIISSTIVNAGEYDIVERSLLEKVMQEQSFSNSGAVDDNDATEIGKLAGANKVVLSVVTLTGGRNMLSVKMIDVKTASIERQKVKVVASGELLDAVEPITLALIDASAYNDNDATVIAAPADIQEEPGTKPMPRNGEVVFYLPAGYEPKKEKEKDLPLLVKFDKEDVGSGTLSTGFTIRVPNPGNGVHKLKIGLRSIKVDLDKYNFFELQIYRWNYLGKAMYGVSVKEQKMIKTEKLLGNEMSNEQKSQQKVKTASTESNSQEAPLPEETTNGNEFVLSLPPQQIDNESHKDNYIKVLLDGKVIGGGTLSKGFEIKIQEKKHRKYVLEIYPTSTSRKGKTDEKVGRTKYEIDTRQQQYMEFMLQTRQKNDWTIYSVVRL